MKLYTDDELTQIADHAADLLTWKDIAFLMDFDLELFRQDFFNENSNVHRVYHKAVAIRKKALRKPVLKMAEHGSPQAEIIVTKLLQDQQITELDV